MFELQYQHLHLSLDSFFIMVFVDILMIDDHCQIIKRNKITIHDIDCNKNGHLHILQTDMTQRLVTLLHMQSNKAIDP